MPATLYIEKPETFSFRHTICSHGWYDLAPFEIDRENFSLTYVFARGPKGNPIAGTIVEEGAKLRIDLPTSKFDEAGILRDVAHVLRLDDDIDHFYETIAGHERLAWVAEKSAGRLLRSPTVFEDLVKTLCTTNCSWSLTKKMVENIVSKLGETDGKCRYAFPTAEAMAAADEDFYRSEIRCGYRSPFFAELAGKVSSGEVQPELWLTSDLPTPELKNEIKQLKGFGDYAAENLLKLLGRYDGLTLDSWLRARFYATHNRDKKCDDKKIERHYAKFGKWKGLAIWCDMTETWFDERF
ncbi:MAG: Fe-S cluster assembly protein HesB [Acidobacteriota bacterium]